MTARLPMSPSLAMLPPYRSMSQVSEDHPHIRHSTGLRRVYRRWQAGHFVLHPRRSNFLVMWDLIILILMIVIAFKVPYEVGFELLRRRGVSLFGHEEVTVAIGVVFSVDVVLQFFISSLDSTQHRWIVKPDRIVREYLHRSFAIDVISVLPYPRACQFLVGRLGQDYRFFGTLALFGLLRLMRIRRVINRYQQRVRLQYTYVNITQLSIILLLTVHLNACVWGFTVGTEKFLGVEDGNTWADALRQNKPSMFTVDHHIGAWQLYTASLYWSVMTTTSIGYGDIVPMNRIEAWVATFIMVESGVIWAYIIGNVCAIASSLNAERTFYENQMDSLNVMMDSLALKAELKLQLREYFMKRRSMFFKQQQVELLRSMSPELQCKVAEFVEARVLKLWFFKEVREPSFIVGLFERFQHQVFPPRELVRLESSLCNLTKGMVLRAYRIHAPGAIWGEAELLLQNKQLLEDVTPVALSYVELQYLTRESLDELLMHHHPIRRAFRRAAMWLAITRAVVFKMVKPSWLAAHLDPQPQQGLPPHEPLEDPQAPMPTRVSKRAISAPQSVLSPRVGSDESPGRRARSAGSQSTGRRVTLQTDEQHMGLSDSLRAMGIRTGFTESPEDFAAAIRKSDVKVLENQEHQEAEVRALQNDVRTLGHRVDNLEQLLSEAVTTLRLLKDRFPEPPAQRVKVKRTL